MEPCRVSARRSKEDVADWRLRRHSTGGRSPRVVQGGRVGRPPSKSYTPEQAKRAMKAVIEDGMTTNQASVVYGVPRSTIWNHVYLRGKRPSSRSSSLSSSSPSSSSSSSASKNSPYPLRGHVAPGDSSRTPNKSPYHFRKQASVRKSLQDASQGKSSPASHSKGVTTTTPLVHQGKSAKDARRSKGSSRLRDGEDVNTSACCFCGSAEDNTLMLGKMCVMRDFRVHYFCLLFSSGLPQNGEDNEGILGFLEEDIMREIMRGKKLSCSYCLRRGATIGCVEKKCKRKYHFPCGIKYNALCMFSDDYRSYCSHHRAYQTGVGVGQIHECPICMETLVANPKVAVWAPCCQRNSWFHKSCLQMLALNAGYFFKCPLCNDKETFLPEMREQGIYVPEQDASWELEPNAFNELLERPIRCDAATCTCPDGRNADVDGTWWEVLLCNMCGSTGVHVRCGGLPFTATSWTCTDCSSTTATLTATPTGTATPIDSPAMSTRHCTRRALETVDDPGGDGCGSPKRRKLEDEKEPSPVEVAGEDEVTRVSPDTVLSELEKLGEEIPVALQNLKDSVRLAHARMKELRLTEREVVRAAQQISTSAITSASPATPGGSSSSTTTKASQIHPITPHTRPNSQAPNLSLSRSQTLPDKSQLTLVGMCSQSSSACTPEVDDKPPCHIFSLDKSHLLALWRCALPLARMEEVLGILEAVFTQREAQVAKAASTRASRHPSPRTTPSRKHTQAKQCITPTTTPWKVTHTPASSTSGSWQSITPHTDPRILGTPYSESCKSVTPHSESFQPSTPHTDLNQSNSQLNWSPPLTKVNNASPWSDTARSEAQHPVSVQSEVQQSCATTTRCCVAATEESQHGKGACRRLLLQPGTTTTPSKPEPSDTPSGTKDWAGCAKGTTQDTTSDRYATPLLAVCLNTCNKKSLNQPVGNKPGRPRVGQGKRSQVKDCKRYTQKSISPFLLRQTN